MVTRNALVTLVCVCLALSSGTSLAQQSDSGTSSTPRQPTASYDRLFLSFVEDATIADRQWWEGQLEYQDGDVIDATLLRGVVAFQPWKDIEVGGRLAFGWTDTPNGVQDGTGATDLDAWGKYYLGTQDDGNVDLAVGVQATIPTGDDSAGLGFDAFALGFFGSLRWRISRLVVSGNAGFRINGDGRTLGLPEQDGKTSARIGVGVIFPITDRLNVLGEWAYEGERFENAEETSTLLAGANWRLGKRNLLRGAIAGGIADGSPDYQLLVGYAIQFP